ncbi:MAG: DUF2279 domain-containing protein [Chitinophagaceae bacterium]
MVVQKTVILFTFLCFSFSSRPQDTTAPKQAAFNSLSNQDSTLISFERTDKRRVALVFGSTAAIWTGSVLTLSKAWYPAYTRSPFHLFNDNREWNQMDKWGHLWTTYHMTRLSTESWKWTGMTHRKSVILGSITALAFQSIIEVQDGFSTKWGFSGGDMTANMIGAGGFVVQELGWKDQRLQFKLSYSSYSCPPELIARRDQLFGVGFLERILKDYNAQTYWVSGNIHSFFPTSPVPSWLNVSIGYGSDGMYGGFENKWKDKAGAHHNRTDIRRVRRFFIAPDIDLTRIRTRSKWVRTIFFTVNMIKFPAPAVELNSRGKVKMHMLYF